jgi:hypothetical protein
VWLSQSGNAGKSIEQFIESLRGPQGVWPDLLDSPSNAARLTDDGELAVTDVTKTDCQTDFETIYQLSK